QILRRIVLPLLTPIIVTLALFVFLGSWNDFMWPLIILADQELYTLPVALAAMSREHVQDNELMMAGAVVTTLPVLILFLALQRFYLSGLTTGSVKG
ncbi:MAG: carbohydrate ABC transporter permease, partial [Pseudomonadota bacterium]